MNLWNTSQSVQLMLTSTPIKHSLN